MKCLKLPLFAALVAVGSLGACGTSGPSDVGASRGETGDLDSGRTADASPPATLASELAPNEVRYVWSGRVEARHDDLRVGDSLGEIDLPIPRFVGAYEPSIAGSGGRSLADYVTTGTLGASTRIYLRVKNTSGLGLRIERKNAHTAGGWSSFGGPDSKPIEVPDVPNDDVWHWVSVAVPTRELALARAISKPEPNGFRLVVSAKLGQSVSGRVVEISSLAVDFFAQAPVVLVHGINDTQANCWKDYADLAARAGFLPDTQVDFAGLADKPGLGGGPPTFNGSVADDVLRIESRLLRLEADYGTRDVHLIGHSKGGLDLVDFLAGKYAALESAGRLRVLSLQTLGSPHAGSVAADILQPLKEWAALQKYDQTLDWAKWGVVVDGSTDDSILDTLTLSGIKASVIQGSGPIEPGLSDLRTTSAAVATDLGWAGHPKIHFATYGFDADFERSRWLNLAGQLTTPPAPGDVLSKYSTDCRGNPVGSRQWTYYCIDEDEVDTFFWGTSTYPPYGTTCSGWNQCGSPLYRQMARGSRASVTSGPLTGGTRSTIHMDSRTGDAWDGNDLVVALSSAMHPRAEKNFQFVGAAPRSIPGQRRFKPGGGVETYVATCKHTGANHIAFLRESRSNMVECTVADTTNWIRSSAAVVDEPSDAAGR
jgi:hypothetical protein